MRAVQDSATPNNAVLVRDLDNIDVAVIDGIALVSAKRCAPLVTEVVLEARRSAAARPTLRIATPAESFGKQEQAFVRRGAI